jgi:two-component system sensor histidine kinase KdpD
MEQVLQNLLHNAVNYTPENTIIKIVAKQQLGNCVISVSDNGKGIPETEIKYLFDKFYRLPETKTGGSGLGLSIVKGFIEAHNGNVKAENIANGGARFIIEIPAEASYLNNLKNE